MSLFRISNHIFELGLNAQELSVYAYLCSLPADTRTITRKGSIKVSQLCKKGKAFSYKRALFRRMPTF